TTVGRRLVAVISRLRFASQAMPPQLVPPTFPGNIIVPSKLGGVKIPSERRDLIRSRHQSRSAGVIPQASSGVSLLGTSGRGLMGKGWVGEVSSSGTVLLGTVRSSIGNKGLPVSRCNIKICPILVATATA